MTSRLPSRADHVGSFLRPAALLEVRRRRRAGEIGAAELRTTEDEAIAELVRFSFGSGAFQPGLSQICRQVGT